MKHKFSKARIELKDSQYWLCLGVDNAPMAQQEVASMKECIYTADIKQYREKRSNRANAYAWELITQLAVKLGTRKEDVYRQYISEIGDNFEVVEVPNEKAKELLKRTWQDKGLGWIAEDAGLDYLTLYCGSSTFDTKQMSRFIDLIVQDCKEQGVQTDTPEQLVRYVEDWRNET